MSTCIPIIDFSVCNEHSILSENEPKVQQLAKDIVNAYSNTGFVYLKNYGISQKLVERAFEKSHDFFTLSRNIKERYLRPPGLHNHGWCELGREVLNPSRPGDYKEVFDVHLNNAKVWPEDDTVGGFRDTMETLYKECYHLALNLLKLLGIGLQLEDPDYFCKQHNINSPTYTALRCLYYPEITHKTDLEENQLRCGEHTDYGSLTILFQDEIGGLEVWSRGGYVAAPPVPGTVIVNLGDLMQMWTADRLVSTKHRVVNRTTNGAQGKSRQSIVCFVHPDENCLIECIDKSSKYPPITDKNYIEQRFRDTKI